MHECKWDNLGNCTVGGCEHPMVRLYKDDVRRVRIEVDRLRAALITAGSFLGRDCPESERAAVLDTINTTLEPF